MASPFASTKVLKSEVSMKKHASAMRVCQLLGLIEVSIFSLSLPTQRGRHSPFIHLPTHSLTLPHLSTHKSRHSLNTFHPYPPSSKTSHPYHPNLPPYRLTLAPEIDRDRASRIQIVLYDVINESQPTSAEIQRDITLCRVTPHFSLLPPSPP